MGRTAILSLCILLLPAVCVLHARDARRVEALRIDSRITPDGRLDEGAWGEAQWHSGFTMFGDRATKADPDTEVAVLYDEGSVYFGIVAFEPRMDALKADHPAGDYDSAVYGDDSFELMISTGCTDSYYQFVFNANGAYWGRKMIEGGLGSSAAWKELNVGAARLDDRWVVEAEIPFHELGMNEADVSGAWIFNVVRNRRLDTGRLVISTFAPVAGLHRPDTFAKIAGVEADFSPYMVGIETWRVSDITPNDDGTLSAEMELQVNNQTGGLLLYEARIRLESPGGETLSSARHRGAVDTGQLLWFSVDLPECAPGENLAEVEIYNARRRQVVYRNVLPLNVEYEPFRLYVDRPIYRSAIYATMDIDEIELGIDSTLPEASWKGRRLVLEVLDSEENVVSGREIASLLSIEESFAVGIPELEPGEYTCRGRLMDGGGELFSSSAVLHVYPPSEKEVRFDDHLRLMINGEPVFPIGAFSASPEYAAEVGLDHVVDFALLRPERIDRFWEKGIYYSTYILTSPQRRGESRFRPLSREEEQRIGEIIREVKDHPGLLMYFMVDEPELHPWLPERLRGIWDLIKREDPYHPGFFTVCQPHNPAVREYTAACDIIAPDMYVHFTDEGGDFIRYSGEFMRGTLYISSGLQRLNRIMGGRNMLWFAPQAFDGGINREGRRAPTYWEERYMVFLSVIHGSRGILWYTANHWPSIPDMKIGIPELVRELRALSAPLLGKQELPCSVRMIRGDTGGVHVLAREDENGNITVFACNTDENNPVTAEIIVEGGGDRTLHVVRENRSVKMQNGVIRDDFRPTEVHIYTTMETEELMSLKSVEEVIDAVAVEDTLRDDPENAAFFRRLKTIRSSYQDPAVTTLRHVFNGYREGICWRVPAGRSGEDVWIEAEFDRPRRVSRVEVTGHRLPEYRVELFSGGEWVTAAEAKNAGTDRITLSYNVDPAAESLKLRLTALGASLEGGTWTTGEVYEIAVYE